MKNRQNVAVVELSFLLILSISIPGLSQIPRLKWKLSADIGTNVTSGSPSNSTDYCFDHGDDESEPEYYDPDADESASNSTDESTSNSTYGSPFNSTADLDDVITAAHQNLSAAFLKCVHVHMKPECYEKLDNDSVYIPSRNLTVNATDYVIEDSLLRICPTMLWGDESEEHENKFSDFTNIISIAGFVVSALGVLVHMVTFVVLQELRNLPGYCMFSLCGSLAVAYSSVFGMSVMHEDAGCDELGMIRYYFFMSSFYWMNAISYDVWRALRLATAKLRAMRNRPILLRFGLYSLYSWGSPLLFVAAGALVNRFAPEGSPYKLTFNFSTCWIEHKVALRTYFAFPMLTLVCLNAGFFMASSFMICSASMRSSDDSKAILWSRFFASLRLAVVMGLSWTFGFIATLTEEEALWIFFAIFTALQGIFIFFGFTLTDKTKNAIKMALTRRRKGANAPMLPASPTHQETKLGGKKTSVSTTTTTPQP